MLSRFAPRAAAAPKALRFAAPVARRNVTTDAASAHVEKSEVPSEDDKPFSVRLSDESFETYEMDPPSYDLTTTKKELKQMYYDMVASRYVVTVQRRKIVIESAGIHSDGEHALVGLLEDHGLTCFAVQPHGNGRRPSLQGEEDPWFLPGGRGLRY
jgi:hypothetical protein